MILCKFGYHRFRWMPANDTDSMPTAEKHACKGCGVEDFPGLRINAGGPGISIQRETERR